MGSLRAEMVVKPTMSLKYSVTSLKCSDMTGLPVFSALATDLKQKVEGFFGNVTGTSATFCCQVNIFNYWERTEGCDRQNIKINSIELFYKIK